MFLDLDNHYRLIMEADDQVLRLILNHSLLNLLINYVLSSFIIFDASDIYMRIFCKILSLISKG